MESSEIAWKLDQLVETLRNAVAGFGSELNDLKTEYEGSATNLIQYMAFREADQRDLQRKLGDLGMSRLARAEAHILWSVLACSSLLNSNSNQKVPKKSLSHVPVTIEESQRLMEERTYTLLGKSNRDRRTRIMVTLPTEAADDPHLVRQLMVGGMDVARINCAHDTLQEWEQMITNVRSTQDSLDRKVKIAMDLAGPKIRTGRIEAGPKVLKISPAKDFYGNVIEPGSVIITKTEYLRNFPKAIAIDPADLGRLRKGDIVRFRDTRNKKRVVRISSVGLEAVYGLLYKTSYFSLETRLQIGNYSIAICDLPAVAGSIFLRSGDSLILRKNQDPGHSASFEKDGTLREPASIPIVAEEVFGQVRAGDRVYFDDGKVGAKITGANDSEIKVLIDSVREPGIKLKEDKGVNFPDSELSFSSFTKKDKEDLKFVIKNADIVNASFINTAGDVSELTGLLDQHGAREQISVILKIETQSAYNNLPSILLAAMKLKSFGVMIARGDLAVETGWKNIGIVQREILSICNSAHIPVVWATQVLEGLAKKGLPSRSEITDALHAVKADCVMLNKGPYIVEAVSLLNSLLEDGEMHQKKNAPLLPGLKRI